MSADNPDVQRVPTTNSENWAPWLDEPFSALGHSKAHAHLIEGAAGLGQWSLTLALAKAWLCDAPWSVRPAGHACGQCASCGLLDANTHPDLCVLMPETIALQMEWPLPEATQTEINDKKRKPSKEIRADDAMELIAFAQRTSARRQGKVALVYPAERLNMTSANALLKILEEPPSALRFVLASEGTAPVLPTIRSRCQSQVLAWPNRQQSLQWLSEQGLSVAEADTWLSAAGESPLVALRLRGESEGHTWHELPRRIALGQPQALTELHGTDPSEWVKSLQKLCHDLLAIEAGATTRFFAPADLLGLGPANSRDRDALLAWADQLRTHLRQSHHPLKPELLLEVLGQQAQSALRIA